MFPDSHAQIVARHGSPTPVVQVWHVIVSDCFRWAAALRDSRPLCCCGVTTRCIIAPLPHRCITTPSYFEYSLQICLPRMRKPAVLRATHHLQPTAHATACGSPSTLLNTNLRVQMTISRAREEGRLTMLQRASTRTIPHGQTTPIPTTGPLRECG